MRKIFFLLGVFLNFLVFADPVPLIDIGDYRSDGPDAGAKISGDVSLAAKGKPTAIFYNPALAGESAENVLVVSGRNQNTPDNLPLRGIVAVNLGGPKGVLSWRRISDFQKSEIAEKTEFRLDEYLLSGVHKKDKWTVGLNIKYLSGAVAYQAVISGNPQALISYGYGGGFDFGIVFNPADNFFAGLSFNNLATFVWWDRYDLCQLPEEVRSAISFCPWDYLELFGEYQKIFRQEKEISRFGLKQKIPKTPLTIGFGQYLDAEKRYLTSGIEIAVRKFRLDFAIQQDEDKTASRYTFSVQLAL